VAEIRVAHDELVAEYTRVHPRSRAAFERASRALPGGLTHDVRAFVPFLPYIERASGAHKWDIDGHAYIDYAMGHGALILGHAHPAVVAAIARQAALGTHPGANHQLEVEWAERIQSLVPGVELVRFTNSGTEAVMLALRIARAATGRSKVLKFQGHFHGWYDAVMPGQTPPWRDPAPGPGISPETQRETIVLPTDLSAVETVLRDDPEIAAVIIEPSGAGWGTVPLPPRFLPGLRQLTAKRGVCFIMDEVITGFRWAPGGAQQKFGVQADLVTMAKIVAGGLPGGAVAGRRDLLEPIGLPGSSRRKIQHPGTFNANPLSAAAGIACLDVVKDGAVQDTCDRLATGLRRGMNDVLKRRGIRGVVYGESSAFHMMFDSRVDPGEPRSIAALPAEDLKQQRSAPAFGPLSLAMLLEGVHVFALGGFLSVAHTDDDVSRTVDAFEKSVRRIEGAFPR
jgi:glutamate-1-semialdehyde 2,1-aminomutase